MAEYIEKQKVINWFSPYGHTEEPIPFETIVADLRGMKSEDVSPVVHGRWEDSTDEWLGTDVYTCSKCRESYVLVEGTPKENLWHYCPNCGAKMDGGNENG